MRISEVLQHIEDRPYPLPSGPWVMRQTWHNLLFAHWPVVVEDLRQLIPECLEIDTFEGVAWVGVVPFTMSDVSLRGFPALPPFPELNVRTYVKTAGGQPGVWFFSLDAQSRFAVWAARAFFHLRYYNARMSADVSDGQIEYISKRVEGMAELEATYGPTGPVFTAEPGSLESWLTDRHCLYTVDKKGRPKVGHIHHVPWPLQHASAEITRNTMAEASAIKLPERNPHLLYAKRLDVAIWLLRSL